MNRLRKAGGALVAAALLGTGLAAAQAQADGAGPQYDTHAWQERSRVPHDNSSGGGGAGGSSGSSSTPAASFSAPPYSSVGPPVAATSSKPEAEEHIAVSPLSSATLLAAISDFSLRGGANTTKYSSSSNGGATWSESFVPLVSGSPATSDGLVWPYNSDPVTAVDGLGNSYLASLYFHSEPSNSSNGIYVAVAGPSAGPVSFTQAATRPVVTHLDPATTITEDKEWIAADDSVTSPHFGDVYVSWTRFVGNSDLIAFSASIDHGVTWSSPRQVSPRAQNGAVQGSQVAVGPSGEIYVVWVVAYAGGQRAQFVSKSTDGGSTFSPASQITPLYKELSFNSTYRKASFASLAVSPANDAVLVSYPDQQAKSLGAQVEFIRSQDAGATFSAPVAINDVATGQQFMPALAAEPSGAVHASWFDTRNSGSSRLYDIYASRSPDGGSTWSPNTRVTPSTIDAGTSSFIGDYAGNAAGGGVAHPAWTSGGFNNGLLQTASLK